MKARSSILPFVLLETLVLLAVVLPVAHARSFGERLLFSAQGPLTLVIAPDETRYILMRSLLVVLALQTTFTFRDLYRWTVITRPQDTVMRLVEAVAAVLVILPLLYYALSTLDGSLELGGRLRRLQIHPMLLLAATGASFLAAYGLRSRWPRWMRSSRLGERVAIVGRGPAVDVVEEELRRGQDPSVVLVGFIDAAEGAPPARTILGPPDRVPALVLEHGLQHVVLAPSVALGGEDLLAVRLEDVRISDLSSWYERLTGRMAVESLLSPGLFLAPAGGAAYAAARRGLDLVVATVGAALALPLALVVALLIKLDSRGPILYVQERVGLHGRSFRLAKFRSMRADAEAASGPVWASGDDARTTRVGRWMRKLRIDEIPQLWSVIRNDMSLVGPRPERPFFVAELQKQLPHYAERHAVKPGITGWAQINHSYGASVDDAFIKLQYDLYYVKHRSLALDVAILLRTVKVVVLRQGAV